MKNTAIENSELISVINVRPSPKPGQTVPYADVRIGPVTVHGFSVVQNKSGNGHFVGVPVRFGSQGKAFPLIELDEAVRAHIAKLVLCAWQTMNYEETR